MRPNIDDTRLAEIENRVKESNLGPWTDDGVENYSDHEWITLDGEEDSLTWYRVVFGNSFIVALIVTDADTEAEAEADADAKANATLIVNAQQDLTDLIAEVRFLRSIFADATLNEGSLFAKLERQRIVEVLRTKVKAIQGTWSGTTLYQLALDLEQGEV